MDVAVAGALVGALVGGALAIGSSLTAVIIGDRRSRLSQDRTAHLAAAAEVLRAVQEVNRRLIDLARDTSQGKATASEWNGLQGAATRWNAARYVAALHGSPREVELLDRIDSEIDQLLGSAKGSVWASEEFRIERQNLGRLGADFLKEARARSGLEAIEYVSLWSWDRGSKQSP